jgi:hypothetical protein
VFVKRQQSMETWSAMFASWCQLLILTLTLSSCGGGGGSGAGGNGGGGCVPDMTGCGPPAFGYTPQGATLNQPYTYTFDALFGTLPITFSSSGTLPPGLNPVTSAGVLGGTPTATGTFPIVVSAVNGVGQSSQNFTVQVFPHGFRRSAAQIYPEAENTATLLASGQVLIAGGSNLAVQNSWAATAQLYDPVTATFTATGSLNTPRTSHTATLLCDPSAITCSNPLVLIAGGEDGASVLQAAELFDPATGKFTSTGSLLSPRQWHTATLLANGKVLIAGGSNVASPASPAATAELYDPATATFTGTGNLNTPRLYHTATLLKNGKVLIAGGRGQDGAIASVAELYDPATGQFTPTGALQTPRAGHAATLLTSGKVLFAGGVITGTGNAETYDPDTQAFTLTGAEVTPLSSPVSAALLPDGTVLIVVSVYAELYDPTAGKFSGTGGLSPPIYIPGAMTTLGSNSQPLALITGVADDGSGVAEVYQ